MNLNELAKEIYNIATEKGWHEKPVAFGDAISNIHGEVSEAWEEYRTGHEPTDIYYKEPKSAELEGKTRKPEGIPTEFADIIIRVLDNCYMYGIDIDKAVKQKMEYNKSRSYRHGGKII
jgi:NTP pyrophosphatase (non-canonical NTP hydrolase)